MRRLITSACGSQYSPSLTLPTDVEMCIQPSGGIRMTSGRSIDRLQPLNMQVRMGIGQAYIALDAGARRGMMATVARGGISRL